jgi:hypothetical protein
MKLGTPFFGNFAYRGPASGEIVANGSQPAAQGERGYPRELVDDEVVREMIG